MWLEGGLLCPRVTSNTRRWVLLCEHLVKLAVGEVHSKQQTFRKGAAQEAYCEKHKEPRIRSNKNRWLSSRSWGLFGDFPIRRNQRLFLNGTYNPGMLWIRPFFAPERLCLHFQKANF